MSKKDNSKSCGDNFNSNDDDWSPACDAVVPLTTFSGEIKKVRKDSDGRHTTFLVDLKKRALLKKGNEVTSTGNINAVLRFFQHGNTWFPEPERPQTFAVLSCERAIKWFSVNSVKEGKYNSESVLQIRVEKLEQVTGTAAKKATSFSGINKGDSVDITLIGTKETDENEEPEVKTIAELVKQENDLSTLETAVQAADLGDVLDHGAFTVFAPTNSAFSKLPSGTLTELLKKKNESKLVTLLKDHVVQGVVTANKLAKKSSVRTLSGKILKVRKSGSKLMVANATVQASNVAINGLVHTVDNVILCTGSYAYFCQ